MHSKKTTLQFIGVIHSPFKTTRQAPRKGSGHAGTIEVFKRYAKGLKDIQGFTHLHLLYWLHKTNHYRLHVQTPWDDMLHGLFATRSPNRVNPIGYAAVKLVDVQGRMLQVRNIDAIEGTPVIDIKPYIPSLDNLEAGSRDWLSKICAMPRPITYVLHIKMPRSKRIRIGALGYCSFMTGHYYYIGSAKRNLHKRIARHHQIKKKRFWHIDYLLAHAKIQATYTSSLSEYTLVRIFDIVCQDSVKEFGASDTNNRTHLFYTTMPVEKSIAPYTILKKYTITT